MFKKLFGGTSNPAVAKPKTNVIVYDMPNADAPEAGAIKGREVAIFRPPVMLDLDGRTMPGVSKDLVARYLVTTTMAMAESDMGPITVEWKAQQGRFVETAFHILLWGQSVDVIHPVAPVSQDVANVWEIYKAGIALKVRELHKGHQRFDDSNSLLKRAVQQLEHLRDKPLPQFSDGEYLFLQAAFQKALVLSALLPVGQSQPEQIVGDEAHVA